MTYCAHENARSRAAKDPPTNGEGGYGSCVIHHPTGILTVLIPCRDRKSKSLAVMKLVLCSLTSKIKSQRVLCIREKWIGSANFQKKNERPQTYF